MVGVLVVALCVGSGVWFWGWLGGPGGLIPWTSLGEVVVLRCLRVVCIGAHPSAVLLHNVVAMNSLTLARMCQIAVVVNSLVVMVIAANAH